MIEINEFSRKVCSVCPFSVRNQNYLVSTRNPRALKNLALIRTGD